MKIHWFGVTLKCDYDFALELWNYFFSFELGLMSQTSRAGRGFQHIDIALHESKLYWSPFPQNSITYDYCHIELTGLACDAVLPHRFSDFFNYLTENEIPFNVTRLDLAFDNLAFTPKQFFHHVMAKDCFTHAKRETFTYISTPEYKREDGSLGSDTAYIGSRSSARFIRVYDERGFTRLEFVVKEGRAHQIASDIFSHEFSQWAQISKAHLLDYIRFVNWVLWDEFIQNTDRADLVISSARRSSLSKMRGWFVNQVSVSLSVFFDVLGHDEAIQAINQMVVDARNNRDRTRYQSLLEMRHPFEHIQNIHDLVFPEFLDDWDLQDYPDFLAVE
ncbi:MAG: replication initiation factor domain-containing protein [Anaerolineales bacterium]|nr:replication initiation factor domain-containing protein [Anaerolineales bacterium]